MKGRQWGVQAYNLSNNVIDEQVNNVWNGVDMMKGFTVKDVIIGFTDWGMEKKIGLKADSSCYLRLFIRIIKLILL
jgi:hypothetical protein